MDLLGTDGIPNVFQINIAKMSRENLSFFCFFFFEVFQFFEKKKV